MGRMKHPQGNRWPTGPQAAQVDPIPQHTKLAPHIESNWSIRDFLAYMRTRGVELVVPLADGALILTAEQIDSAILAFRGIDEAAYRAEAKHLLEKYGPTLLANLGFADPQADQQLELAGDDEDEVVSFVDQAADDSIIKIIEVLDKMAVPTDAGRRTCGLALQEAGISRPNTSLFARAVKLRRAMYGQAIAQPWQFAKKAEEDTGAAADRDQAAASLLMSKLSGGSDG